MRALSAARSAQKIIVTDYIFEKDKLFANLNLTDPELAIYDRYYKLLRSELPTPDLVIYLQAPLDVLRKRLRRKNVANERAISDEYMEEVVKAYEHFFFHYSASDLLVVNTAEIDFVERSDDLQVLLRRVSEPIKGTQYFLPLGQQDHERE
jgi:deoxyguanosine kinase